MMAEPTDPITGFTGFEASPTTDPLRFPIVGYPPRSLAADDPLYLEWVLDPADDLSRILTYPINHLVTSDCGVRVKLWLDPAGMLHLRIGAWGKMVGKELREVDDDG